MIRPFFHLRCHTTRTVDLAAKAICRIRNREFVHNTLIDAVEFYGPHDERMDLTKLFRVHKIRPHVYAARFHVHIAEKGPFPHGNFVVDTPRLQLSVLTAPQLVLQTRLNPDDDVERLMEFIDSLFKDHVKSAARVIDIKAK